MTISRDEQHGKQCKAGQAVTRALAAIGGKLGPTTTTRELDEHTLVAADRGAMVRALTN